ncbi:MAG TPA: helix-turn-helix domain-containing protein [Sphingomonadaceae bacterium]|nr:helix-turn-helix domain-containing protein [Sphingomonadaceae bacterium]
MKQEIARLARRESRGQIKGLRRASAQFRRDIARLKRDASGLSAEVARLKRSAGKAAPSQPSDADSSTVRFRAQGVASHRKRLGVSAADFGKLIGVTGHTVYKWEHGASRPRKAQLSALASIRRLGRREALARLKQVRAPTGGKKRRAKR